MAQTLMYRGVGPNTEPGTFRDPNVNPTLRTLTGYPTLEEARTQFDRCVEWESPYRKKFMEDIKFANADSFNGYQWPDDVRHTRDLSDRPCLTLNVVQQHNNIISNTARRNKQSARILGMGNGATQESANMVKALIRHIEHISHAQHNAYTPARQWQIEGGIGWWRIITDFESNDSFDQEIYIIPITDPLSVYMDPDIQNPDGSDAKFAFVFDFLPDALVRKLVPNWSVDGPPKTPLGIASGESFWIEKDHTMVAEWFRKVPKSDQLVSFVARGERQVIRASRLPENLKDRLFSDPNTLIRDVEDWGVEWKLIIGEQIVDETDWPGKFIPLIRCVGKEYVIEGILDRKGHTRAMSDAQRMYNYNAALSVDTPIPTPYGWTLMGEIENGDIIFDKEGRQVEVAEALPIRYDEECFKVTFSNGYSVVTDAAHIWRVKERGQRTSAGFNWYDTTLATAELMPDKHFIVLPDPLKLPDAELPLHPYLIGMWLGDGHARDARILAHVDDAEEEKALLREIGYEVGETIATVGKGCVFNINGIRHILREMGLTNNKHIPPLYLRASRQQRLALLQGLMDTDGHFALAVNQCVFVNKDHGIAGAVLELCASLGIKATVSRQPKMFNNGYISDETFHIQFTADPDIPVFRLQRKAILQTRGRKTQTPWIAPAKAIEEHESMWNTANTENHSVLIYNHVDDTNPDKPIPPPARTDPPQLSPLLRTKWVGVKSIEPVDSVPVRCLRLNTADHLFLCGKGMIPTHNSGQVEFGALQSKTPWIAPAKAIEEHESMWNTANTENHSVLIYNHVDDTNPDKPIPPPARTDPPQLSPLFEQGMQTAMNQMMMVSGQYPNQLGMEGNERTGAAIQRRQDQGDTATYHFQDNYADALKFTYRQIIDLFPKVYDTKRVKHILADDGQDMEVMLDPGARQAYLQELDHNNTVIRRIFNPNLGKYDLAEDVGPDAMTSREETVEALTLILTQAPALTGIIGDILLRNMPFDEAQEAALRLKRLVPPQALGEGPTQNEQMLQQQVGQLTTTLAKAMQRHGKDALKLVGKDQMRDIDVYKAETDRIKAMAPLLPTDQEGMQALIEQLVGDALKTHLMPILKANLQGTAEQSSGGEGNTDVPPIEGAQKAPDGNWYLRDPTREMRGYLRIEPLATEHKGP